MKRLIPLLFAAALAILACEKSESNLQAVDKAALEEMLKEIKGQVDTAICTDAEEWSFTALGSKACGGPQAYIAYPHSIDTTAFLDLVKRYTEAEDAYNKKHGVISDCMMVMPPSEVICKDEKPVLVYPKIKVE